MIEQPTYERERFDELYDMVERIMIKVGACPHKNTTESQESGRFRQCSDCSKVLMMDGIHRI